jgi:DNA-binding protein H-NS
LSVFNLDTLTVAELLALDARIKAELARARDRARAALKAQIDAFLADFDLEPADIAALYGFKTGRASRKGVKVATKYRNPTVPAETWSGRGRRPRWLMALTAQGRQLEEFRV